MGTRIEAAAATNQRGRVFGRGALHLSDKAALACLQDAGHSANEIDLLINAGIYKDRNAAEPALASIIQEDVGANATSPPRIGRHGTFSFDILNGGCGVTTAAELCNGFIGPGRARLAMIVAADADPSPSTTRGFPFAPAGGAMLLAHTNDDSGFMLFETRTFPEDAALFDAYLRWDPHAGFAQRGRNVLEIKVAPAFGEHCVQRAATVVEDAFTRAALSAADIDLLIASQYPPHFSMRLAERLGIPGIRVAVAPYGMARAHTAGPIAALSAAMRSGAWARARHTLFVTAGAGLTIGVALYRAFSAASSELPPSSSS
jgi:3-oxoacyl-[acyl-carrier-protein] synthase-3